MIFVSLLILLVIAATLLAAFFMCAHLVCNLCIYKSYEGQSGQEASIHYAHMALILAGVLKDGDKVRRAKRLLEAAKNVRMCEAKPVSTASR